MRECVSFRSAMDDAADVSQHRAVENPFKLSIPLELKMPNNGQTTIRAAVVAPDGKTIVSGSRDGKIQVLDAGNGNFAFQRSHASPLTPSRPRLQSLSSSRRRRRTRTMAGS